jgi:fatty acid desaturase
MRMSEHDSGKGDSVRKPWHSLIAATLAFLLLMLSLAALYVLSMGALGPVIAIAGIVILIVMFHYFVWGWWLGPAIRREQELEDSRSEDAGDKRRR